MKQRQKGAGSKEAAPFCRAGKNAVSKLYKMNMQNLCIPTKFMPGFVETSGMQKRKIYEKNR